MCVTDSDVMTLAVKVALNPNTNNEPTNQSCEIIAKRVNRDIISHLNLGRVELIKHHVSYVIRHTSSDGSHHIPRL